MEKLQAAEEKPVVQQQYAVSGTLALRCLIHLNE